MEPTQMILMIAGPVIAVGGMIYFPMRAKLNDQRRAVRASYDALTASNRSMDKLTEAANRISGLEAEVEGLRANLFDEVKAKEKTAQTLSKVTAFAARLQRAVVEAADAPTHEELREALKGAHEPRETEITTIKKD